MKRQSLVVILASAILQIGCSSSLLQPQTQIKREPASFKPTKSLHLALSNFNNNKDKEIDSSELVLAWMSMTEEFWRTKSGEKNRNFRADFNRDEAVNLADIQYWTKLQRRFPGEKWQLLDAFKLVYDQQSKTLDEEKIKSYRELISKSMNTETTKAPEVAEIDFNDNKRIDNDDDRIFGEAIGMGRNLLPAKIPIMQANN